MTKRRGLHIATLAVGDFLFQMEVPAVFKDDKPFFEISDLKPMMQEAVRWIVANTARTPATFKFLRAQAGITAEDLADLLGVTSRTITRWETGEVEFRPAAWETIARIALDRVEGRENTLRRLRAPDNVTAQTVVLKAS